MLYYISLATLMIHRETDLRLRGQIYIPKPRSGLLRPISSRPLAYRDRFTFLDYNFRLIPCTDSAPMRSTAMSAALHDIDTSPIYSRTCARNARHL